MPQPDASPPDTFPPDTSPRASRLSAAPILLAALLLFAALLLAPQLLNDGDTLWQVHTGQWMFAHLTVPVVDPFSLSRLGAPWPPHQWLGQFGLAAAFDAGGWSAVRALAAGCAALSFGLLAAHLARFLPPLAALATAVAGFALVAPSLLARPHLLALPCLELWCAGLVFARAREQAPSPWTLLAMLLWANLHASFPVGLVLAGTLAVEAVWTAKDKGRAAREWGTFLLLALLAASLTPQGPAGLIFPLRHLGLRALAHIPEWQPETLGDFSPLEMAVLLALYLSLTGRLRLPPWRALLALGLLHAAFAHARNGQLLGMIAPLLACPVGVGVGVGATLRPPLRLPRAGAAAIGLLALVALGARLAWPSPGPAQQQAALAAVPPCLATQPGLNDYRFGGDLIFAGLHPFVDSRAELYGDAFLDRYARLAAGDPATLEAALAQWHFAWALLVPGSPLLAALERRPGWERLYTGPTAVVLARAGACP